MAKFAIPKKVTFEDLGEEFASSYLTFRSIPTQDFEKLQKRVDGTKNNPELPLAELVSIIEEYFLEGQFYDFESKEVIPVKQDDLKEFDTQVIVKCFKKITGDIDPKVESESVPQS